MGAEMGQDNKLAWPFSGISDLATLLGRVGLSQNWPRGHQAGSCTSPAPGRHEGMLSDGVEGQRGGAVCAPSLPGPLLLTCSPRPSPTPKFQVRSE